MYNDDKTEIEKANTNIKKGCLNLKKTIPTIKKAFKDLEKAFKRIKIDKFRKDNKEGTICIFGKRGVWESESGTIEFFYDKINEKAEIIEAEVIIFPKIKKLKIDLKFDSSNELKEEEKLIIKGD